MAPNELPTFVFSDYVKFFGAGALAATSTHAAATPIDVVKTRIQVDDALKGYNMVRAARQIVSKEGTAALLTGFGPTAMGYLAQGGAKFAGYEFFKKHGLTTGFARMAREEGLRGFYSGFVPLLFKQVPFAVGQFSVHEAVNEVIFRSIGPERKAKLSKLESTGGAGDPKQGATSRMFQLAREFGPKKLLTSGLGPRLVMTCALVSGQFVIYAQCKALTGAPASIEIHKESS
uniref:Mitochondrial phosphate carrier protein n=1 Tax=Bionectria ochroleuca TaxID=29856 RepID=A0A0B7JQ81_BIOOC